MAIINFPPTAGQPTDGSFTYAFNDVVYSWTGTYWSASGSGGGGGGDYVEKSGDTMTGDLTVPNLTATADVNAVNVIATGDIQSTSQNGGQLAGFRNQFINGDMRIWQRGTTGQVDSGGNVSYQTADRWLIGGTANTNVGRIDDPEGVFAVTQDTAGQYQQRIELPSSGQSGPFRNNTIWTLSFWSQNPIGNISVGAFFGTDTLTVGTSWTISTALAAIDTSGTWTRYSATFTCDQVPAAADLFASVFVFFTAASSFTGAQLEPGPVATPFEHRPIGTELALCQRYYELLTKTETPFINTTSGTAILSLGTSRPWTTSKRTDPTVAIINITSNPNLQNWTPIGNATSWGIRATVGANLQGAINCDITGDAEL